ncbi:MAG: hypothetical protein F4Z01_09725 [Gammaproteobacteria bacterium]|nr:hypothetical protein [Gammaproteobacteria bacterium]MYF39058.1 hypothetical protein [Gammaproteobacteria bacterium]
MKTVPATEVSQMGMLSKHWLFLYLLGCLVSTCICVVGGVAWWFEGRILEYLPFCGFCICISLFFQSTTLIVTAKRTSGERREIPSGSFAQMLFRLFGSKVSVSASMHLVGVSLLLLGMMIWKTYSQFFGVWLGVSGVGYMALMPILHWRNPRYTPRPQYIRDR